MGRDVGLWGWGNDGGGAMMGVGRAVGKGGGERLLLKF